MYLRIVYTYTTQIENGSEAIGTALTVTTGVVSVLSAVPVLGSIAGPIKDALG